MILPRRRLDVVSSMDAPRVCASLVPHVGSDPRAPSPYVGRVWIGGFELRPHIRHLNTFVPFATAVVQPAAGGSRVIVTMRMGPIARVFMSLWLGMACGFVLLTITIAVSMAMRGELDGAATFAALFVFTGAFPIFGLRLARRGFRKEADPLERFLREVLDARPSPPYR